MPGFASERIPLEFDTTGRLAVRTFGDDPVLTPRKCCEPETPPGGACACPDAMLAPEDVPAERGRYFTGKYMTARDLAAEQAYFVSRHRLHQRALHGRGLVCGLDIVEHPTCAVDGWVIVTPGIAIDCNGRELVVREPMPILLSDLFSDDVPFGREDEHRIWDATVKRSTPKAPAQPNTAYLLAIRYAETCVEEVPVFADTDGCAPRKAANRVSEGICFRLISAHGPKPPACWGPPEPVECPCPLPQQAAIPESLRDVLAPLCDEACAGAVPLALLRFKDTTAHAEIEVDGRRYLPGPLNPRQLTHICEVSWNHDGETCGKVVWGAYETAHADRTIQTGDRDGIRLTVTFDRPLHESMRKRVGVSGSRYFTVRFENHDGNLQSAGEQSAVTLSPCGTRLHYDIQKCHVRPGLHLGQIVHISLDCDFLTDRYGRAVDGDHLHGSLARAEVGQRPRGPTGDGIEGGTFESWFQLT